MAAAVNYAFRLAARIPWKSQLVAVSRIVKNVAGVYLYTVQIPMVRVVLHAVNRITADAVIFCALPFFHLLVLAGFRLRRTANISRPVYFGSYYAGRLVA